LFRQRVGCIFYRLARGRRQDGLPDLDDGRQAGLRTFFGHESPNFLIS
jgi:hypothetical protein